MNWFLNLKIKIKLLAAFILLALITGVAGFVSYFMLNNLSGIENKLYHEGFISMQDLGYANASILTIRGDMRNLLESLTQQDMNQYIQSVKAESATVDSLITNYNSSGLSDEDKAALDMFRRAWNQYKTFRDQTINLALSEKLEEARTILNGDARKSLSDVRKSLHELIDSSAKSAEGFDKQAGIEFVEAKFISIALSIFSFVIALVLGLFISSKINKPLKNLESSARRMVNGELNVHVDVSTKDEIGSLADSFNKMVQKISQQFENINELPAPVMMIDTDFNVTYMNKAATDVVGKDLNSVLGTKCYDQFKTIQCKTENCATHKAMLTRKFQSSQNVARPQGKDIPIYYAAKPNFDKQGNVIGGIEFITNITEAKEQEKYLEEHTRQLLVEMEKFSQGDLTVQLQEVNRDDVIGRLYSGFNSLVRNIRETILTTSEAVQATASASSEISASAEQMAAGSQEQSAQTSEVAAAVEQMATTILQTTRNATTAAELSKKAGLSASNGGEVVKQTVEGMNRIAKVVSNASDIVKELGNSSSQIGEIVQVINDIADQTNLLALNAAIEAARAGEQGRGFAVVADEVRKLAERTTKATKEIAAMIKHIQDNTGNAVESMEAGTKEVESGRELAGKAITALDEIIGSTNKTIDVINQVAAASEEQSSAAEQISRSVEGISSVTNESASGIQQIAKASEDLSNLTTNLQNLVSKFNTGSDNYTSHVRRNKSFVKKAGDKLLS